MAIDAIPSFLFPYSPALADFSFTFTHYVMVVTLAAVSVWYFTIQSNHVYLLDFVCYFPPNNLRTPLTNFIEHLNISGVFSKEGVAFQEKVMQRAGVGDEACFPAALHELPTGSNYTTSRAEVEEILFSVVKDLLEKHKVNPKNIDIIISNCSLYCPTPSITAMIINKFGLRSNVKSISLGGMGCSSGLLSISLAKELLKVHPNSLALVLSMEAVTTSGYQGEVKSMLLANTIFRMGGVAVLLSNKKQDKRKAHYELKHLVRTHIGANDQAYSSVYQQTDELGFTGVSLSRALVQSASHALRTNLAELGPLTLPFSEQIRYGFSLIIRKFSGVTRKDELYVPKFKKAFEHFCIHAGGRAIIDAVESSLKLEKEDGEASRMTLYRFGNTSSSSIWYELSYLEAKGKVKKGDRVWQIAFGSGFKCNSAVWKSISNIEPDKTNVWSDRIQRYPVELPNTP